MEKPGEFLYNSFGEDDDIPENVVADDEDETDE